MNATTLQNVLDDSSYLLGETGTPTSQISIRTRFANDAKNAIAKIRNWSWEMRDGDTINFVYSTSPTNNIYTYTLTPSAGTLKNKNAIYTLKFTDQNSDVTFFTPINETTMDYYTTNGRTDNAFFLKGDAKSGYTLVVNALSAALPTQNVNNAWNYRYFYQDPDFVNTTDTTSIPSIKAISEYIAGEVFFGYREQAQYELSQQRYQSSLEDLALQDMKLAPFTPTTIKSFRDAVGASDNFKTYY